MLVGDEDRATPPDMAEAIAAAIPGAMLEVLKGARHLTPLERPREIVAALRDLAAR